MTLVRSTTGLALWVALTSLAACSVDVTIDEDLLADRADVASDDIGIPTSFQQNFLMTDDFFENASIVSGDGLQRFLENTPYGSRSWLADHTIDGARAADAIVAASQVVRINPIVMLARMQVEKSLIAKTSRPGQNSVDYAFGCGCPDYQACNPAFRGLDKQIECAGDTLRRWFDASVAGTGRWRVGGTDTSLDGYSVSPQTHATASLYAYTPWVYNGGNHLVWTITRLYALHFADMGELDSSRPLGALEVYWARNEDGSYKLHALAAPNVVTVEYYVDGYKIATSTRADGDNFPASYVFSLAQADRFFEVKGFDQSGTEIALGVGMIDVTDGPAPFIRQLGAGFYDLGIERMPAAAAYVQVRVDGYALTDETTGQNTSDTGKIRYRFDTLGERGVEFVTYAADGTVLETVERRFTFR